MILKLAHVWLFFISGFTIGGGIVWSFIAMWQAQRWVGIAIMGAFYLTIIALFTNLVLSDEW